MRCVFATIRYNKGERAREEQTSRCREALPAMRETRAAQPRERGQEHAENRKFFEDLSGREPRGGSSVAGSAPGDVFGFIGHNGAGKTTTIRAITGVMDFSEGNIWVDGESVRENPLACKRKIAFVPDNPDLYDYLTGIQYLNFVADIFGMDASARESQIRRYAEMFEMTGALGDLVSSYSHGMKQRLALIAAFMHEPRLLVFDEPFVGLDPSAVHTVKQLMQEFCARGAAVFFSTHVLDVAEKLCNRVGIIRAGKLVACGDIEAVKGDQSLEEVFLELQEK